MWTIEIGNSSFFWPGILAIIFAQASYTMVAAVLGDLSPARRGFMWGAIASLFPLGVILAIFPDWFGFTLLTTAMTIGVLVARRVVRWDEGRQAKSIAVASFGGTTAFMAMHLFREPLNFAGLLPHIFILVICAVAWLDIEQRSRRRARSAASYRYDDGGCGFGDDGSCSFGDNGGSGFGSRRHSSGW